jgi:hypothetical protein
LVYVALENILQLCQVSSELNGEGVDWLCIMEKAKKLRRAICQTLDRKEISEGLLGIYTGSQIRMLNSIQFSMEEGMPSTPPSLRSLPKWRRS